MRKFLQFILSFIAFLVILPATQVVSANNKIESIHIDVEIHNNGSITVRENRQTRMYEDTELYIEMVNLQDSELLDFSVEGFTEETDWDIDDSFEEKAYRYGVIDVSDGYELAWGISDYGDQEYNVMYSLSNIVRDLEDGQSLYWNFDTFTSLPTDRVTVEVHADFPLDEEVVSYYGFGFEGPMAIENGRITWTGYGLTDSEDVTLLIQFPEDTFNVSKQVDMTLDEQAASATSGSSYNQDPPMPWWLKTIIGGSIFLGVSLFGFAIYAGVKTNQVKKENNHFFPNHFIKENKNRTSQTPPRLEGDLGDYDFLISKVVLLGGGFSNYFFAYLLIWSFEDRIKVKATEKERFLIGTKITADIQINDFERESEINQMTFDEYVDLFEMGESTFEEVIWGMLLEIADSTGHIDGDDVKDWSEENAESINDVVKLLEDVSADWLEQNGYLVQKAEKLFGSAVKIESLTPKGEETVTEIIRFNNFITDIKDESLKSFSNWQELLIWSALFGRAESTIKYLEEFEPTTWAYLESTYPYTYGHYYAWNHMYTTQSSGMASGGYSGTGGGGMSSSGGGGGAGGGGGGGSR